MSEKREWIHDFYGGERNLYETAYTAVGTFDKKSPEVEVEGVVKLLGMKPGDHILDWCGGWGRHSIPLAKRGFHVTTLDFQRHYLERGRMSAQQEGVSVNWVQSDFRETPREIQADCAVNLFTAGIGYFGEENDIVALRSLREALKPGGMILIDTMNLFWIMRNFLPSSWHKSADGTKWYIESRSFDFRTHHIHCRNIFLDRVTGEEMSSENDHRVYSGAELSRVLETSGFQPLNLYGDFDGSEFTLNSKRLIITARRY